MKSDTLSVPQVPEGHEGNEAQGELLARSSNPRRFRVSLAPVSLELRCGRSELRAPAEPSVAGRPAAEREKQGRSRPRPRAHLLGGGDTWATWACTGASLFPLLRETFLLLLILEQTKGELSGEKCWAQDSEDGPVPSDLPHWGVSPPLHVIIWFHYATSGKEVRRFHLNKLLFKYHNN